MNITGQGLLSQVIHELPDSSVSTSVCDIGNLICQVMSSYHAVIFVPDPVPGPSRNLAEELNRARFIETVCTGHICY